MRSILYRFPDLAQFERMMAGAGDSELELGLPAGEGVDDGEWVLAVFELGRARRATSAAARAAASPDGSRLVFEPRDWRRLAEFTQAEAQRAREARRPSGESPSASQDARSTAPPAPIKQTIRPSGVAARVLIVDDDPDIRDVVAAMLEAVGLEVVPVGSAEDALERVRAEAFDLLVFDWNLPKMSGVDLCRTIRREPSLAALPVLFLTANASSQDMVEAFASGGDDYVVKPFRAPELGARIFSLLRRSTRGA
ncbi:MAG TPA: response regulator [Minicystis sp.]|nr:response regulator [Minicystis sp.]